MSCAVSSRVTKMPTNPPRRQAIAFPKYQAHASKTRHQPVKPKCRNVVSIHDLLSHQHIQRSGSEFGPVCRNTQRGWLPVDASIGSERNEAARPRLLSRLLAASEMSWPRFGKERDWSCSSLEFASFGCASPSCLAQASRCNWAPSPAGVRPLPRYPNWSRL